MFRKLRNIALSAFILCSTTPVGAEGCLKTGALISSDFPDVPSDSWFAPYTSYVKEKGLMSGYVNGNFGPYDVLNRGMVAKILSNLAGNKKVVPLLPVNVLTDLGETYYTDAAMWAFSQGIMTGYTDGRFGGEDPIRREQLVTALMRYNDVCPHKIGNKENALLNSYPDKDMVSFFAKEPVQWALSLGIIGSNGTLNPQGQCTRAEAAKMIGQFHQKLMEYLNGLNSQL